MMRPLPDYIVLKPFVRQEKELIILDPTNQKEQQEIPCDGEVVAVGESITLVSVGDKVFFNRFAPDVNTINREKFLLVQEKDIYAIYEDEDVSQA